MKVIESNTRDQSAQTNYPESARLFRFDIFKGIADQNGKVQKVKSMGFALLYDGSNTYNVKLKTLLNEQFFMLPEKKVPKEADYIILTREPSQRSGRKYYWNNVGAARSLTGVNSGLMKMEWDLFNNEDIYMNLYPLELPEKAPTYAQEFSSELPESIAA